MCTSPNLVGTRELKCTATQMNASMLRTSLPSTPHTAENDCTTLYAVMCFHVEASMSKSPESRNCPRGIKGDDDIMSIDAKLIKMDSDQRPKTLIWLRYIKLKSTTTCLCTTVCLLIINQQIINDGLVQLLSLSLSFLSFLLLLACLLCRFLSFLFSLFSAFLILVFRLDHVIRSQDRISST